MIQPVATGDIKLCVDTLLAQAAAGHASDLHVEPVAEGYEIRFRIDGLLQAVQTTTQEVGRAIVSRLMVMAQLLTYRQDIPQEGRLHFPAQVVSASSRSESPNSSGLSSSPSPVVQARASVMPTKKGLRMVVRLPASGQGPPLELEALGLDDLTLVALKQFAHSDAGMLLVTGPAGSGKTTTLHALLGHIAAHQPGLSIVALEDPVERDLTGVTQIEVSPFGELTYERALRSMLRQDPQVLMLGEIRDAATASLAVQAALSGHRLVSTLHAATPGGAIARLLEMGIEPYQLTSALSLIMTQRLLRRNTPAGYRGRVPVAEVVVIEDKLRQAILDRADSAQLQAAAQTRPSYRNLADSAKALVDRNLTTLEEVQRVLGQAVQF